MPEEIKLKSLQQAREHLNKVSNVDVGQLPSSEEKFATRYGIKELQTKGYEIPFDYNAYDYSDTLSAELYKPRVSPVQDALASLWNVVPTVSSALLTFPTNMSAAAVGGMNDLMEKITGDDWDDPKIQEKRKNWFYDPSAKGSVGWSNAVNDYFETWKYKGSDEAKKPINVKNFFETANPNSVAYNLGNGIASVLGFIGTTLITRKLGGVKGGNALGKLDLSTFLGSYMYMNNELYNEYRRNPNISDVSAAKLSSIVSIPIAVSEYVGLSMVGKIISQPAKRAMIKETVEETVKSYGGKAIGKELYQDFAAKTIQGLNKRLSTALVKGGESAVVEGVEEYGQGKMQQAGEQIYDQLANEKVFGTELFNKQSLKDDINNAFWGGAIGGILGLGGAAMNSQVYEETMFKYIGENITKGRINKIEGLKAYIKELETGGKLTPEQSKNGVELVDSMVKVHMEQMPKTLTDVNARYQAFDIIGKRNKLSAAKKEFEANATDEILAAADKPALQMLDEQIEVYNKALSEIANTKKPINDVGLNTQIAMIGEKYMQSEKALQNPEIEEVKQDAAQQEEALEFTDEEGGLPDFDKNPTAESYAKELEKKAKIKQINENRAADLKEVNDTVITNDVIEKLLPKYGYELPDLEEGKNYDEEIINPILDEIEAKINKQYDDEIAALDKPVSANNAQTENAAPSNSSDAEFDERAKVVLQKITEAKGFVGMEQYVANIETNIRQSKKAGRNTEDDEKFLAAVKRQIAAGKKPVAGDKEKQDLLDKLIKINYANAQNNLEEFYGEVVKRYFDGNELIKQVVDDALKSANKSEEEETPLNSADNPILATSSDGTEITYDKIAQIAKDKTPTVATIQRELGVDEKSAREAFDTYIKIQTKESKLKKAAKVAKPKRMTYKEKSAKVGIRTLDDAIASRIGKINQKSFERHGDKNLITRGLALNYLKKSGEKIDTVAHEIANGFNGMFKNVDESVIVQAIVDFMVANPSGINKYTQKRYDETFGTGENEAVAFISADDLTLNEQERIQNNQKLEDFIYEVYNNLDDEHRVLLEELIDQASDENGNVNYAAILEGVGVSNKSLGKIEEYINNGLKNLYENRNQPGNEDFDFIGEDGREASFGNSELDKTIRQAEGQIKVLEAARDRQQNVVSKLKAKLTENLRENQLDMFGNNKTQSLFDDKADQQGFFNTENNKLQALNQQIATAKEKLDNLKKAKDVEDMRAAGQGSLEFAIKPGETQVKVRKLNGVLSALKKVFPNVNVVVDKDKFMEAWARVKKKIKKVEKSHGGNKTLKELGVDVIDGFYSPIQKRLAEQKQDKFSAKKWMEIVGNKDEAKYTGVYDMLAAKKPDEQVSKGEIMQWMRDNRIEIKEIVKDVVQGKDGVIVRMGGRNSSGEYKYILHHNNEKLGDYYSPYVIDEKLAFEKWVEENDGVDEVSEFFNIPLEEVIYGGNGEIYDNTKFSQYQLEGEKTGYKEVLITLPNKEKEARLQNSARTNNLIDKVKKRQNYTTGWFNIQDEYDQQRLTKEEADEWMDIRNEKYPASFKSSHFDEPNILVHLRMNIRTSAMGEKILFLEEIQSDWGQKGKKEGFKKELPTDNEIANELYGKPYLELSEIEQHSIDTKVAEMVAAGNIPPAPFVTDTNSWVKLGLKFALQHAIKEGATSIAWTTGEQQNERYDLSKQIDGIYYNANLDKDDSYNVSATKGSDEVYAKEGLTLSDIEDTFGKDIAKKIKDNEGDEITNDDGDVFFLLKGEGLKVGGKGMIGFYGSPTDGKLGIVGNVAESLFGKGSVKTTDIDTGVSRTNSAVISKDGKYKIFNLGENEFEVVYGNVNLGSRDGLQRATDLANEHHQQSLGLEGKVEWQTSDYNFKSAQHSISITPEMRSAVEEGLPEFKRTDSVPDAFFDKETGTVYYNPDKLNPNTAVHEFGHVWESVAKEMFPEQYAEGLELTKGTAYEKEVRNDPNYAHLGEEGIAREALAKAIGDQGAKITDATTFDKFKEWVNRLFDQIAKAIGFKNIRLKQMSEPGYIANMQLDEFANKVAKRLLSGKALSNISSAELAKLYNDSPVMEARFGDQNRGVSLNTNTVTPDQTVEAALPTAVKPVRDIYFNEAMKPLRDILRNVLSDPKGKTYTIPERMEAATYMRNEIDVWVNGIKANKQHSYGDSEIDNMKRVVNDDRLFDAIFNSANKIALSQDEKVIIGAALRLSKIFKGLQDRQNSYLTEGGNKVAIEEIVNEVRAPLRDAFDKWNKLFGEEGSARYRITKFLHRFASFGFLNDLNVQTIGFGQGTLGNKVLAEAMHDKANLKESTMKLTMNAFLGRTISKNKMLAKGTQWVTGLNWNEVEKHEVEFSGGTKAKISTAEAFDIYLTLRQSDVADYALMTTARQNAITALEAELARLKTLKASPRVKARIALKQEELDKAMVSEFVLQEKRGKQNRNKTNVIVDENAFAEIERIVMAVPNYAETIQDFNDIKDYAFPEVQKTNKIISGSDISAIPNYHPVVMYSDRLTEEGYEPRIVEDIRQAKHRIGGAKQLAVGDVYQKMQSYINATSHYSSFALPVRNARMLLFEMQKQGLFDGGNEIFYNRINEYLSDNEDLSQLNKFTTSAKVFNRIMGKFYVGVLGWNLWVAPKQTVSYLSTIAMLGDRKYGKYIIDTVNLAPEILKQFNVGSIKNPVFNEMMEKNPLAKIRFYGLMNQELGELLHSGTFGDFYTNIMGGFGGQIESSARKAGKWYVRNAMNLIRTFDTGVVFGQWKASKQYVTEKTGLTESDGDPYWQEVISLHNQLIRETQSTYDMANRAAISRREDPVVRSLNMFASQPIKNFNLMAKGLVDYYLTDDPAKKALAKKFAAKSMLNVIVFQSVLLALLDTTRDALLGYDDEDEKLQSAIGRSISYSFGNLPFGGVYSTQIGNLIAQSDNFTNPTTSPLHDLINIGGEAIENLGDGEFEQLAEKLLLDGSKYAGIPIRPFKDINTVIENY